MISSVVHDVKDYIKLQSFKEAIIPLILKFSIYYIPKFLLFLKPDDNPIVSGIFYWLFSELIYRIISFTIGFFVFKTMTFNSYLARIINNLLALFLFILIEKKSNKDDKYDFRQFYAHIIFQSIILSIALTATYLRLYEIVGVSGLQYESFNPTCETIICKVLNPSILILIKNIIYPVFNLIILKYILN